ncbi:MAG: DUF4157 domain-containing protein [Rhodospirillales bacterium]|nr:DUF4157 domain-containing protein [Rhodospirillales bacterium]
MRRTAGPRPGFAAAARGHAEAGSRGLAVAPPAYGIGLADRRADAAMAPGRPLDPSVRAALEPRFGLDLGAIRVHTDASAAARSAARSARAFTSGRDIVFADGAFAPETTAGRRLLAHEITHVAQQAAGVARAGEAGRPGDRHERQADAVAETVSAGGSAVAPLAALAAAARPVPAAAAPAPVVQCDLALPPPVRASGAAPTLSDAQKKDAIAYNQARLKGVDAAVVTTVEDVTGAVMPKRQPAAIDETFVVAVARWQGWFNLVADGRLTPLTVRTFASELLAEAASPTASPDTGSRLRATARILDEQVASGPLRAAGAGALPAASGWAPPSDIIRLRQDLSQDFQTGSAASLAPTWLARAHLVRSSPSLSEGDRMEYLAAIAGRLSTNGRMAEAMEVISLIGISSKDNRTQMVGALDALGKNAAESAVTARDYLKALLRLSGRAAPDQPADPQAWLEKHAADVGKAIADLERILGGEAGRQLTTSVLKSSFTTDTNFTTEPKGAGSIAHLPRDPKAGNRMLADCDVYATFGVRLLRAQGWQPVGYFSFQGETAADTAHAVGIARRGAGSASEYVVVDSLASGFIRHLGTMADDAAAIKETDRVSGGGWGYHYYAPAVGDGAIDPRLNQLHPESLKYTR